MTPPVSFYTNYSNYNLRRLRNSQANPAQNVSPQFQQYVNIQGINSGDNQMNGIQSNNGFHFPKISFGNDVNVNVTNNTKQPTEKDTQFQLTGNPEQDAQNYAQLKGIDLEQAETELQSMYGNPNPVSQQQTNLQETNQNQITNSTSVNQDKDAQFQLTGNPEQDAQNYAQLKNIDLEQAKTELQSMYGNPQQTPSKYLFINN